jgi:hypothetical protein
MHFSLLVQRKVPKEKTLKPQRAAVLNQAVVRWDFGRRMFWGHESPEYLAKIPKRGMFLPHTPPAVSKNRVLLKTKEFECPYIVPPNCQLGRFGTRRTQHGSRRGSGSWGNMSSQVISAASCSIGGMGMTQRLVGQPEYPRTSHFRQGHPYPFSLQ